MTVTLRRCEEVQSVVCAMCRGLLSQHTASVASKPELQTPRASAGLTTCRHDEEEEEEEEDDRSHVRPSVVRRVSAARDARAFGSKRIVLFERTLCWNGPNERATGGRRKAEGG